MGSTGDAKKAALRLAKMRLDEQGSDAESIW